MINSIIRKKGPLHTTILDDFWKIMDFLKMVLYSNLSKLVKRVNSLSIQI